MARPDVHTGNMSIEQPGALIGDLADREPEIVLADSSLIDKEYQDELAFMADWITIRLEPSGAENAPDTMAVWVNGRGAEVLYNKQPVIWTHLPVGQEITVRRSVVEIIARSKTMRFHSDETPELAAQLKNKLNRNLAQTQPMSILHDPSSKGRAWASELMRRSF